MVGWPLGWFRLASILLDALLPSLVGFSVLSSLLASSRRNHLYLAIRLGTGV